MPRVKLIPVQACLFIGLLFSGIAAAQDRRAEGLALTCYTCHSGRAVENGGIPSLEPLTREELIRRLTEFRAGAAEATVMDRISAAYTDEEIDIIADYITARNKGK
ncbi:MAG: sulfide dehydrogenase [Gammaproteobacteria bacterium]